MHVSFPLSYFFFSLFVCLAAFSRTSMTSLRSIHNLAWSWWRSMWSLWRRGQRLNRTTPNNWGRPPIFSIVFFWYFPSAVRSPKFLPCGRLLVFARLHVAVFGKKKKKKCLCGLVISAGQNLTCLWIAPSWRVLAPACSPSSSTMAPSLQAHIWWSAELSWRGEEVGAAWAHDWQDVVRRSVKGDILVFTVDR